MNYQINVDISNIERYIILEDTYRKLWQDYMKLYEENKELKYKRFPNRKQTRTLENKNNRCTNDNIQQKNL